jgi:hypothetical protein
MRWLLCQTGPRRAGVPAIPKLRLRLPPGYQETSTHTPQARAGGAMNVA